MHTAFVSHSVESMLTYLQFHENVLGWTAFFFLIMMVATLLAVPLVIIRLPSSYFNEEKDLLPEVPAFWRRPYLLVKNIIGAILVLAGLAMLILPGQGLLTLIIGLGLMNFPGKRSLIRRQRILETVNRLRAAANKEPIAVPDDTDC
jgi:hypothetical protein